LCMPAFGQTTATGQTVDASQINATSITGNLTKINESDPVYWYNKGEELLNASKYNDAIKADDEAIRLASNSAEDWYNKCEALYNQSKYNESIAACDESSRKASILAMTWNNKGVALKKQGKYVDAIQAFDEAIRFDPILVNAWRDKARILVEQEKYEDALQAFDEALRIDDRDAEIWYDKSNLLVHLGRIREAKNAYLIAKGDGWDVLPFVESPAGKHSCQIGTPDISEFSINWTDNKNYTKITKNVFDDSSVSLGLESWKATGYSLYAIENATDSTAALEFSIELSTPV
jgi:tetratricopeptide (TPR) repeat protein